MSELFVEIGVEEVPAAELEPAVNSLSNAIWQLFKSEHTDFTDITTYFTPRRIAVCINGLKDRGEQTTIVYPGPRAESAYDKDGKPTQAAIGFARSKGVSVNALKIAALKKGAFVQIEVKKKGILTKALVRQRLANAILNIPFRKSMRWGNEDIKFIRPVRWLIVLYNGKVVPVSIGSVKAASYTTGLRTGKNKRLKIKDHISYLKTMEQEGVIVSFKKREDAILTQARRLAEGINGKAEPDTELLETVANLTEAPDAVIGKFDKRFMDLPEEVIMSVMKVHQKYIPVLNEDYQLMPYFIGISNNPHGKKDIIRKGYERVLHARLEDAEFYYNQDIKQPLDAYVELLKGMVLNPVLGSLYDKTLRIEAVSAFIADAAKVDESTRKIALKAARFCKADLATRLVAEFPELQGTIGRHLIKLVKEADSKFVADAVYEHNSKDAPQTSAGAVVSIADKIDTVVGFFSIGQIPTGTQDPYGLRRASIGIINTILHRDFELDIKELIKFSISRYKHIIDKDGLRRQVLDYIYGRFKGILRSRHYLEESFAAMVESKGNTIDKLIDAVLVTQPENILEADQRITGLKDIVFKKDFELDFLAFKRIINITKNCNTPEYGEPDSSLFAQPEEKLLYDKYMAILPETETQLAKRNYTDYIRLLKEIVPQINTFFDKVLVMCDDKKVKSNRLKLLAKIKNFVMRILDITKLI